MVAGAGNEAGTALAGIDQFQLQMETAEIDGRGEAGRPTADHQAIIIGIAAIDGCFRGFAHPGGSV